MLESPRFIRFGDSLSGDLVGDKGAPNLGGAIRLPKSAFRGESFNASLYGDGGGLRGEAASLPGDEHLLGDCDASVGANSSLETVMSASCLTLAGIFEGDLVNGLRGVLSPTNSSSDPREGVLATWVTFLGESGRGSIFNALSTTLGTCSVAFVALAPPFAAAGLRIGLALNPVVFVSGRF